MSGNQRDIAATKKFFAVKKYSQFDTASPKYKPKEIGFYSLDIKREFIDSKESLRYYVEPENPGNVNFDLREGFETRKIKEKGRDINILYWIKEHLDKFLPEGQASNSKLGVDFVTQRGLITKLMLTPYEDKDGWFIAVTLFNGTYYLNEVESDEKIEREAKAKDDEESCWGWKFEQYLTADSADGRPNTDVPYNNIEGYYTFVKSELKGHSLEDEDLDTECGNSDTEDEITDTEGGNSDAEGGNSDTEGGNSDTECGNSDTEGGNSDTEDEISDTERNYTAVKSKQKSEHSLMFSGEIDALKVDRVKGNSYIEFKTTKEWRKERRHLRNFQRYKSLRWWVQSHMTGVKEIVCGFKDIDGDSEKECVVRRLVTLKTDNMPRIAKDRREPWKPNVCLNFLDEFLTTIKTKITQDDYRVVYTLKWNPRQPVMISQPLRDSEYNFLPKWFVDGIAQSEN